MKILIGVPGLAAELLGTGRINLAGGREFLNYHTTLGVLKSKFHKIREWLKLEGTSGGHLIQSPCHRRDT